MGKRELGSLHTVAAASENLVSLSARSWQVAKVADNDAVLHISANYNDGEGLQQLPSTVGTIEQRENATTGASEQAENFAHITGKFASHVKQVSSLVERVLLCRWHGVLRWADAVRRSFLLRGVCSRWRCLRLVHTSCALPSSCLVAALLFTHWVHASRE